jgi:hypothetical protein
MCLRLFILRPHSSLCLTLDLHLHDPSMQTSSLMAALPGREAAEKRAFEASGGQRNVRTYHYEGAIQGNTGVIYLHYTLIYATFAQTTASTPENHIPTDVSVARAHNSIRFQVTSLPDLSACPARSAVLHNLCTPITPRVHKRQATTPRRIKKCHKISKGGV